MTAVSARPNPRSTAVSFFLSSRRERDQRQRSGGPGTPMILDQRDTPTCVAAAWTTALVAAGVDTFPEGRTAREWLWRSHRLITRDGVSAPRDTSIMAGAYAHVGAGVIETDWEVLHRRSDILDALDAGPLVASLRWFEGFEHPFRGIAEPIGGERGYHAVALVGRSRNRIRFRNSRGDDWGVNGEAEMYADAFTTHGVAIRFTPTQAALRGRY